MHENIHKVISKDANEYEFEFDVDYDDKVAVHFDNWDYLDVRTLLFRPDSFD